MKLFGVNKSIHGGKDHTGYPLNTVVEEDGQQWFLYVFAESTPEFCLDCLHANYYEMLQTWASLHAANSEWWCPIPLNYMVFPA